MVTHEMLSEVQGVVTVTEVITQFRVTKSTVMNHIYRGRLIARQAGDIWLISYSSAKSLYKVRENG